jgi:hypothetical protein
MAFGAMLHLIVTAIARVAVGLQDDLDVLAAARKPSRDRDPDRDGAA